MDIVDLRQLRQFVTLAETLNFHRAAERLHMAQPPLSVSIRKLEDEVGTPLFTRTNREVRLTAEGIAALDSARACLFHAEETRLSARQASIGLGGRLRVAFVGSATYRLLPELIPRFRKASPAVRLELMEATNAQVVSMLHAQEVDLGIIRTPLAQASDLALFQVESDVLVVALPGDHRLARKVKIAMGDLRDEPFVQYAAGQVPGLHAITTLVFHQAGFLPSVTQEAVQVQTVLSLVQSGLGIALVPSASARQAPPRVVFRPIRDLPAAGRIGISFASLRGRESSAARRFREMAVGIVEPARGARVRPKKPAR